jgi:hypothetical protein
MYYVYCNVGTVAGRGCDGCRNKAPGDDRKRQSQEEGRSLSQSSRFLQKEVVQPEASNKQAIKSIRIVRRPATYR